MNRMQRLLKAAEEFEPRGTLLSTGRSLLAFAQLAFLLAAPDRILFLTPPTASVGGQCAGDSAPSLWCVTETLTHSYAPGRIVAAAILLGVVLGYRPRWLCIPHWYVAFSIPVDITVVNGGEQVAEVLTMLLIPLCLGDGRTWHWREPDGPLPPAWRGSAYAAHLVLRCQIAVIYLDAALSKLTYPAWRHGTALRTLVDDPEFGAPLALRPILDQLLSPNWVAATLTWAVVATEISIALSMAGGPRIRKWGLRLALCLHGAIIVGMGLFSFGLIMIALLMTVCTGGRQGKWRVGVAAVDPERVDRADLAPVPAVVDQHA